MSRFHIPRPLLAGFLWTTLAIPAAGQSPLLLDREALLPESEPPSTAPDPPSAPLPEVDTGTLQPVSLSYSVEMNLRGTRIEVDLERTVERVEVGERPCWRIVDAASAAGEEATDVFDLDGETLAPLRRDAQGTGTIRLTYGAESVTGEIATGKESAEIDVPLDAPIVADGPGLDLTLAALPLRAGFTIAIRFFEPIECRVRVMQLAVTGEEKVTVPAGTYSTWLVEITSLDGNDSGTATLSVMKDAPHHVVRGTRRLPAGVGGGVMTTELTVAGGSVEPD